MELFGQEKTLKLILFHPLPLDQDVPSSVQPRNPPPLTAASSIRAQSDELNVLKNLLLNVKIRRKKKVIKKRNTFLLVT